MSKARQKRLAAAKSWNMEQKFDEDSHIVKAYRKRFGVDKDCAMRELCMLGVLNPAKQTAYENELKVKEYKKAEGKTKTEITEIDLEQNDHFYYIVGYTSGGAPYGITWEEARQEGLTDDFDDIL